MNNLHRLGSIRKLNLVAIVFLFALTGCASVKTYPICFFDPIPPEDSIRQEYIKKLVKTVELSTDDVVVTQDGRWLSAKIDYFEQKRLSKIWPRLACIGQVISGTGVKRDSDCVDYIKYTLKTNKYDEFDLKTDVALSDEAIGPPRVVCKREWSD